MNPALSQLEMAENPLSEKRKRVASHRLANADNDGEVLLNTHRDARARAIEEEQHKRAAQVLAQVAARRVQPKSGNSDLIQPALTATTTAPGLVDAGSVQPSDLPAPNALDSDTDADLAAQVARKVAGAQKTGESFLLPI